MASMLRDKIKNCVDTKSEVMHIAEWDCDIEVKTMSAKQRADIIQTVMNEEGKISDNMKFQSLMITASCYDPETHELIFSDEDTDWLMEKNSSVIERIAAKIMKFSGFSKDAIEEAEKN